MDNKLSLECINNKIYADINDRFNDLTAILINALNTNAEYNLKNNSNKIQIFREHFFCIINALINQQKDLYFSKEEVFDMVNAAVCNYLLIWIENARNTRQTGYSFSKQKYFLSENQQRHKTGEDTLETDSAEITRIYRGLDVYKENVSLYTQVKNRTTKHDANQKTEYNFIELCFAEAYSQYKLDIYTYLFLRKKPLEIISNVKKDSAVELGYEQFFSFIEGITKENSDRLFTIKSLFLFKLECTFRFIFAYQIAEYTKDNNISINTPIPEKMHIYYKRIDRIGYLSGTSISNFITYNKEIIDAVYNDRITDKLEHKIYTARMILDKAQSLFISLFPQNIYCEWTEDDFCDAASFLKHDYKILDLLMIAKINNKNIKEDIDLPSKYDYIKHIYLESKFIDEDKLYYARNILRKKAEEKNKRT